VLDALLAVRRRQDPSLTLRHSCLHASCGTCRMRVNGREVLACVTRLDGLGDRVVVEPLAGAPLAGDLVVDVSGFYGRSEPVGRPLVRLAGVVAAARGDGAPAAGGVAGPELDEFERFEDCLECGLCLSACPVAASDPRYLARPPWPPPSGCWRSRAAPTGRRCSAGWTTPRAPGAATWPSSARRSARPASTRRARSCDCGGGCSATGCPGWPAGTTGRDGHERQDAHDHRRRPQADALARRPRAAPGHLGVRGQPAHRPRPGRHLYLHLIVLSTLLRGPGAWDGLVELFRRPLFLAFDVLLVLGLAFHGLNGLRVALVGSGLLVDRHKALLVAAVLLVGLVGLVAAVRTFA
jgi:succinate dehydrogenase hydrophobic anchor subunit